MTPKTINKNVLNAFAATDVNSSGSTLIVTGTKASPKKTNIISTSSKASFAGRGKIVDLAITGSPVVGKSYVFEARQKIGVQELSVVVTVVATSVTASVLYTAAKAALDANIAAGLFEGSCSVETGPDRLRIVGAATNAFFSVVSLSTGAEAYTVTNVNVSATGAAVAITNAAPRVLTTAAHGLATGDIVLLRLTNFAGAAAADVNDKTFIAVVASGTTYNLLGTAANGAITNNSDAAVVTQLPVNAETFAEYGQDTVTYKPVANYIPTNKYVELTVVAYEEGDPGEANLRLNPFAQKTLLNTADSDVYAAYNNFKAAYSEFNNGIIQ